MRDVLLGALQPLLPSSSATRTPDAASAALGVIFDLRTIATGANMFVALTAHIPGKLNVNDVVALELEIRDALVRARKETKGVQVRFRLWGGSVNEIE